ncbi:MAG: glycosyltransferase family 4 protein [Candidatus Omnitrophica bacterium]|nr:glycosyltransferase family 4 protein [Candidatus Omnitrophota bacterium]
MRKISNILFISYDGFTEYLGRSQALSYISGIMKENKGDFKIAALTYEKPELMADKLMAGRLRQVILDSGIQWKSLRYHKSPKILSTIFDVFSGIVVSIGLIRRYKIGIVHARSYVPALIGLFLKKCLKTRFIFDMRGFWADERVEGGIWKCRLLYRAAKYFEKEFLLNADMVVTLSESAKDEIRSFRYWKKGDSGISVIPTSADLKAFNRGNNAGIERRLKEALNGKFVFIYVGSLGVWYETDGIYDFFRTARRIINNAHLLILTRQRALAESKAREKDLDPAHITITRAEHEDVPGYLNNADVGLAFYKPGYSRKGCCPTKVGEYLACGLPVVINEGIGDMDRIIEEEWVGSVISGFNSFEYARAVNSMQGLLGKADVLRQRCRAAAEKYFSLEQGTERYIRIYRELLKA